MKQEASGAKWRSAYHLLCADLLHGILFDHEDRGSMFLQNVGSLSPDFRILYPTIFYLILNDPI
jgi:hypothetical protein